MNSGRNEMQIEDLIHIIINNGYLTTGTALAVVLFALVKIWHKYENYLKYTINNSAALNQESLSEIKELIKDSNKITQNVDNTLNVFQNQIDTLEGCVDHLKKNTDASSTELNFLIREIENIKYNLELLRVEIKHK